MHKPLGQLHKTPNRPLSTRAGLKLTTANTYEARQSQDYPEHQHGTWELIYYRTGYINCVVAGESFRSRPGMLLVIPPQTPHHDVATTAYKQFFVRLQSEAAPAWQNVYYDDPEHTLSALFVGLVREWRGHTSDRDDMLTLLLGQLDLLLQRGKDAPEPTVAEHLVRAAERLLEERSNPAPRIQDVAAAVNVSPSTLRAHFAELRGYSPKTYLQTVRQARALELISGSDLCLAEVAELCGYHSASHLSRHIKRDTGRTPGSFRFLGQDAPTEL